jgi:uncharacterized protein (UPF0335 family)
MNKFISIDSANVDVTKLTGFLQRGLNVLDQIEELKKDFKEIVQEAVDATSLDKKIVGKFIKTRFKANTKDIVDEAATLEALSNAVDN